MPSKNVEIFNPEGLTPTMGYSHVAKVMGGTLVFIAGQVAADAKGAIVGKGDFRGQVEQVFANVKRAVEAAGGTFADIVKTNVYLVDSVPPADIAIVREVRARYVGSGKPPASTLIVVSRLAAPDWLIEIEAVAAIG